MPTQIIAELGINCNGSLEIAKKLIDVAHSAGCQYVKFQKREVDLVYTKEELSAKRESPWGTTFRDQKIGLEFFGDHYLVIDAYCYRKGIKWFASPWDLQSLGFLNQFEGCEFIKVPSALITNESFLKACKEGNKPVILSTGMSTIEMVDNAVSILGKDKIHCIMHCTSTYPSKPDELNLNCIPMLKKRYPWAKIGFSNHNPGIIFMPIAVALGAEMIEAHVTLDRSLYGSDQASSIEPEGMFKLCKYIRGVEKAMGDGVKKIYDSEVPIIKKLRK